LTVVDASVVANALGDDGIDGSVARSTLLKGGDIAAPDLMDPVTVSVLRKRWIVGALSTGRSRAAVDDLGRLPVVRLAATPGLQSFGVRWVRIRTWSAPKS